MAARLGVQRARKLFARYGSGIAEGSEWERTETDALDRFYTSRKASSRASRDRGVVEDKQPTQRVINAYFDAIRRTLAELADAQITAAPARYEWDDYLPPRVEKALAELQAFGADVNVEGRPGGVDVVVQARDDSRFGVMLFGYLVWEIGNKFTDTWSGQVYDFGREREMDELSDANVRTAVEWFIRKAAWARRQRGSERLPLPNPRR